MKKLLYIVLFALVLPLFSSAEEDPQVLTILGHKEITTYGNIWVIVCSPPYDIVCFKVILAEVTHITIGDSSGEGIYDVESNYTLGTNENGYPVYTFELIE